MVIGRRLVVALGLLLVTSPAWAQRRRQRRVDSRGSASCSCSAICRRARRATTFRRPRARRLPTSRTSSRIGAIASSIPPGCWRPPATRQAVTSRASGARRTGLRSRARSHAGRPPRRCRSDLRCASPTGMPSGERRCGSGSGAQGGVTADGRQLAWRSRLSQACGGGAESWRRSTRFVSASPITKSPCRDCMKDRLAMRQVGRPDRHVLHHVARRDRRRRHLAHARRQQGADRAPDRRHARK